MSRPTTYRNGDLSRDRIVEVLAALCDAHGYSPSLPELAAAVPMAIGALERQLKILRGQGRVTWVQGQRRTIRVSRTTVPA